MSAATFTAGDAHGRFDSHSAYGVARGPISLPSNPPATARSCSAGANLRGGVQCPSGSQKTPGVAAPFPLPSRVAATARSVPAGAGHFAAGDVHERLDSHLLVGVARSTISPPSRRGSTANGSPAVATPRGDAQRWLDSHHTPGVVTSLSRSRPLSIRQPKATRRGWESPENSGAAGEQTDGTNKARST